MWRPVVVAAVGGKYVFTFYDRLGGRPLRRRAGGPVMDRETFAQLVSAWLDDPQRTDLHDQLESVVAHHEELRTVRDQCVRLEQLLRMIPALQTVVWDRLRERISGEITHTGDAPTVEAKLDARLRAAASIDARVEWQALRRRIGEAIDLRVARPRVLRVRWRLAFGAGALAAAAALALLLMYPPRRPAPSIVTPGQRVMVSVLTPAGVEPGNLPRGRVQVVVFADPELESELRAGPSDAAPSDGSEPEEFFMVEPPPAVVTLASAAGPG